MRLICDRTVLCEIEGEVYKTGKTDYGCKLFVRNTSALADGAEYSAGNCIIYSDVEFNTGDTIRASGEAECFDEAANPGEFDSKRYYSGLKIDYKMHAEEVVLVKKNNNPIYSLADKVRKKLCDTLYEITDDKSASVFAAMLLGEKDELDSGISDLFTTCGIGHILAISGLHISLIGMGFYKILRRAGVGCVGGFLMAGSMIIFYGIMTGNGVSTIRAVIMFITAVYANVAERTYDLISAASLAAAIMLIDSPLLIYNSGFLLSFTAVIGIGAVNPVMCKIIPSRNKIIQAVMSGLSIQLMTLPIIMYSYYEIPVYSVLINLIVIPLMTYVMISALAAGITGSVIPMLGKLCIGTGVYILRGYEWLCNICLKLPGAVWVCGRPDMWQIAAYYGILRAALMLISYKEKARYAVGIAAALVIIILRFHNSFEAVFLDVGQGDGIYIRSNGYNIMIDGGSSSNKALYDYTLEPFLMSEGVEVIDYAFVTHPDTDHISGIKSLINEGRIKINTLVMPSVSNRDEAYMELVNLAEKCGTEVITIHKGMQLDIGGTVFTCLNPEYESGISDRNDYSTVLLAEYNDFTLMLTGDISSEIEAGIAESMTGDTDVSVLKAAHHGSAFSNSLDFLQKFKPSEIVISCGKDNEYGHPAKEALARMNAVDADIRLTCEEGAIIYKRGGIRVFL